MSTVQLTDVQLPTSSSSTHSALTSSRNVFFSDYEHNKLRRYFSFERFFSLEFSQFKRVLATLTEEYIPLKEEFRKRKGQWISKATIKLMKQRGTAWRKYRQFQSAANYDEYRKIKNKVNEMVKADGDAHRKRLLKGFKRNPKRFYG